MEIIDFSKVPTIEPVPVSLSLIPPNVPRGVGSALSVCTGRQTCKRSCLKAPRLG